MLHVLKDEYGPGNPYVAGAYDVEREGLDSLLAEWHLKFIKSPSSKGHHGAYEGGLLDHCNNVFYTLHEFNSKYKLGLSHDTIYITSFFHDLCKVGLYLPQEGGGVKYEKEHPKGHAVLSLWRIEKHLKLTDLERQMIAYHMGVYGTHEFQATRDNSNALGEYSLQQMTKAYEDKRVRLFHMCDDMAAQFKDK